MEDLATDRIYRLMIAQRMKHSEKVEILGEAGLPIRHTPELIRDFFDEELDRLLRETAKDSDAQMAATLREARGISEEMIRRREFDPA
jgi:malate synthase